MAFGLLVFAPRTGHSMNKGECKETTEPQKFVVLFDGTWNTREDLTNIERLKEEIETHPNTAVSYIRGIGSGWRRFSGGLLGFGFGRNVRDGYEAIARCYQPGDQIYIFGFSRGAYSARTLAAMIQQFGVLNHDLYRPAKGAAHCSLSESNFRDDFEEGYKIMKSAGKNAYFRETGKWPWSLSDIWRSRYLTPKAALKVMMDNRTKCESSFEILHPPIEVVGVFETVGSLGWSHKGREIRYLVSLEDLPNVKRAYQALSIDESRSSFQAVPWRRSGAVGAGQELEEVWFSGAHSDIGGGYDGKARGSGTPNLADISLHWMASKLKNDGLVGSGFGDLSEQLRRDLAKVPRHIEKQFLSRSPIHRTLQPGGFIHASVCQRMLESDRIVSVEASGCPYRPIQLREGSCRFKTELPIMSWDGVTRPHCEVDCPLSPASQRECKSELESRAERYSTRATISSGAAP